MLQEVHLPLGLVQPLPDKAASTEDPHARADTTNSSRGGLVVGSRVLVLPPDSWLWQPAEVTAVLQPAAAASEEAPAHAHTQQQAQADGSVTASGTNSSRYTVQLVRQQRILTVPTDAVIPVQHAAALSSDQQAAGAAAGAAAAAVSEAAAAAFGGSKAEDDADVSDSGSDMSVSSDAGISGASSDDEASSSSSDGEGVRRLGAPAGSSVDVLDHARCVFCCLDMPCLMHICW